MAAKSIRARGKGCAACPARAAAGGARASSGEGARRISASMRRRYAPDTIHDATAVSTTPSINAVRIAPVFICRLLPRQAHAR
ncbi:hypothetical protein F9K07_27020 [Hydrogenophaga sp. BPS33]|nr:hypothetical protein F9K07_27020 [Hydrogenophaga sp. BPS33]